MFLHYFGSAKKKRQEKYFLQHHHRSLSVTVTFTIIEISETKEWLSIHCIPAIIFQKNPGWKNVFQAALFSRCHWEKYRSRVCIFIIIWSRCLRSIWPQAGHKRKLEASANSGNVLRSPLSEHQCNHYHNWKDQGAYFFAFLDILWNCLNNGKHYLEIKLQIKCFNFPILCFEIYRPG